jgi:hypothetical protein
MSDGDAGYLAGSLVTGVVVIIIAFIIVKCNTHKFKQEAVDVGAAYYDSKTAEFKWGKP